MMKMRMMKKNNVGGSTSLKSCSHAGGICMTLVDDRQNILVSLALEKRKKKNLYEDLLFSLSALKGG